MFSKLQLVALIIATMAENIVNALLGKDISVEGITSKGIANTGGLANIGNVAISGDLDVSGENKGIITANKLSQRIPNWEVDIKSLLNTNIVKDSSKLYAKLCLVGNELSLIISGIFTAKEEANTYKAIISNKTLDIPNEIASKIFRADGSTLDENPTSTSGMNPNICEVMYVRQNPSISSGTAIIASSYTKGLSVNLYGFGATTEDAECYLDLRVQLLII